jgi:hypothetical protein
MFDGSVPGATAVQIAGRHAIALVLQPDCTGYALISELRVDAPRSFYVRLQNVKFLSKIPLTAAQVLIKDERYPCVSVQFSNSPIPAAMQDDFSERRGGVKRRSGPIL